MENMRRVHNGPFMSNRYAEPFVLWGSFVLDGATDPSEFSPTILSVTREANATPTIVFRVTLLDDFPGLGTDHLKVQAKAFARGPEGATNDTQVYNCNVLTEGIDPAPAGITFTAGKQIDIIVVESAMAGAAVGVAVDTAGIIVHFEIIGDRVEAQA
jgi:hypothetical protein